MKKESYFEVERSAFDVRRSAQRVDIIMPVRDAAQTLPAALDSILNQSFSEFRLLAIEDGSNDATPKILQAYARRDPRIIIHETGGMGLVPALNLGLAKAEAPFIARTDADDINHPERLQKQVDKLTANLAIDAVACCAKYEGGREGFSVYVDWSNGLLTPEDIRRSRFVESPLIHPTLMFRHALIDQYGPYRDDEQPEDYELWLRWMNRGVRIEKLPEELLTWTDPPERLTRSDRRYATDAFYRVKLDYLAAWLEENNPHHPQVVLWGASRRTRLRMRGLSDLGMKIKTFIDSDPKKIGTQVGGIPVLGPDALPDAGKCFVIPCVSSRGAREEIVQELERRGYEVERDFICAA